MALSREQFQSLRDQGLTVDQIVRFEAGEQPAAAPMSPTRKRQEILAGRAAAEAEASQAQADAVRGLLKAVPGALSTAGGLYGAPGAGIGAGIGETAVQTAQGLAGEGFDPTAIAREAALAYGGTKAGGLLGKGLGKVGGVVTGSLRRKAVEKAAELYAKASTVPGMTLPVQGLIFKGLPELLRRAGRAGSKEVDHALEEVRNFLSNKVLVTEGGERVVPQRLTPTDLHEIRQVMDQIAQPFYNAVGKLKLPPDPAISARVRVAKLIADNAREALRKLVPEAQKFEQQASRLITARKFIPVGSPSAAGKASISAAGTALGYLAGGHQGAIGAGLTAHLLSQPQVAMALGSLLENPTFAPVLAQLLGQAGQKTAQVVGQQFQPQPVGQGP